jgi:hypothetical protein
MAARRLACGAQPRPDLAPVLPNPDIRDGIREAGVVLAHAVPAVRGLATADHRIVFTTVGFSLCSNLFGAQDPSSRSTCRPLSSSRE